MHCGARCTERSENKHESCQTSSKRLTRTVFNIFLVVAFLLCPPSGRREGVAHRSVAHQQANLTYLIQSMYAGPVRVNSHAANSLISQERMGLSMFTNHGYNCASKQQSGELRYLLCQLWHAAGSVLRGQREVYTMMNY